MSGPLRRGLRVTPRHLEGTALISTAATMIGVVCLWVLVQLIGLSTFSQSRAQDLLHDEFRGELAAATAPVGPTTDPGDPVALLRVPQLGLEQVVVEGTASGDLQSGPGHLRNTVLPGQSGTSVVMGRAATYGSPFARLGDLQVGDAIEVVTGQGAKALQVTGIRRAGDPLPQPLAAEAGRVTLVTAEGSGRLAALRPGQALFVDAETTKAFPAPSGLPRSVPDTEKVMAAETSATPLLVLHLVLLVGLVLLVVVARTRWSAVMVWLVASPLVLALAWSTTDVATRLLPNLA